MGIMKRSVLRQRRPNVWGVRRHPVDSGLNEGEMKSPDRLDHRGVTPREPPRRIGVKSREIARPMREVKDSSAPLS